VAANGDTSESLDEGIERPSSKDHGITNDDGDAGQSGSGREVSSANSTRGRGGGPGPALLKEDVGAGMEPSV